MDEHHILTEHAFFPRTLFPRFIALRLTLVACRRACMLASFLRSGVSRSAVFVRGLSFPILLLLCLSAPGFLCAQNSNGALRGEVIDSTAARVVGARVVVQPAGSSISRAATTNGEGEFRIDSLLPGTYQVVVTAKGFAEASASVDVAVSLVRDINVTLKPEGSGET